MAHGEAHSLTHTQHTSTRTQQRTLHTHITWVIENELEEDGEDCEQKSEDGSRLQVAQKVDQLTVAAALAATVAAVCLACCFGDVGPHYKTISHKNPPNLPAKTAHDHLQQQQQLFPITWGILVTVRVVVVTFVAAAGG